MGETEGKIYPEANSSIGLNLSNQASCVLPKNSGEADIGQTFPIPKGRNKKEKGANGFKVSPKPNRANNIKL